MLSWRIEEDKYVNKKINEYLNKIPALARIFISEKQMNKNINYISDKARLEYRRDKLDSMLNEVKEERERINDLVNDLNIKFDDYLHKQQNIISKNIKPFEIKVKPYNNSSKITLEQLEVVTIQCEPLKLSFIQEKVGGIDNE